MSLENKPHFSKALGQFLDAFPDKNQQVIALLAYGLFKNTIRQAKMDGRPVRDSQERALQHYWHLL